MDQDYAALARAIRGPMRTWWKRTGVWWIGLMVLLLAVDSIGSYYLYPHLEAGTISGSRLDIINLFTQVLDWIAYPGVLLVWLLAAIRVNSVLSTLFDDVASPHPQHLAPLRFTIGMAQGLIPLAVYLSYKLIAALLNGLSMQAHGMEQYAFMNFFYAPVDHTLRVAAHAI